MENQSLGSGTGGRAQRDQRLCLGGVGFRSCQAAPRDYLVRTDLCLMGDEFHSLSRRQALETAQIQAKQSLNQIKPCFNRGKNDCLVDSQRERIGIPGLSCSNPKMA